MELLDFYPSPSELIKSELRVLDHLRNDPYISVTHSTFAQDAAKYYSRNKDARSGFEFFSYFDVYHGKKGPGTRQNKQKPNLRLMVAARIELTKKNGWYSNVTYCLAVCRIRTKHPSILRKFHFDVTVGSGTSQRRSQQHPQCHLQYCGEMIPHMATAGCLQTQLDQMHPSLSQPRIFFWPMSLALLIDMTLHEFPDPRSANFRASSEWRGLVRKQEALVLQPFYQKCVDVIVDRRGKNQTLADEFYVG